MQTNRAGIFLRNVISLPSCPPCHRYLSFQPYRCALPLDVAMVAQMYKC